MYLPVTRDAIPASLQPVAQWLCWRTEDRDGKPTKVPVDPARGGYASVSDPATWTSFETAYDHYRDRDDVAGIGFVFTAEDPYVGVDLDDCRSPDTGRLDEWAQDIIRRLDSYTEASPSGTGVHVLTTGTAPDGKCRDGDVELYSEGRYFTMTGRHLDLTPKAVNERTDALAAVHAAYVADTAANGGTAPDPASSFDGSTGSERSDPDLEDADILEYAMNASNGDKFEQLWRGDTSGYKSHSEADQALCNILAFWTGGNPKQMERLFNKSRLVREKWRDRPDYRERTIKTAVHDCPAFYEH